MNPEICVTAPLRIDPACGMMDAPPLNEGGTYITNFGITVFSDLCRRSRQLGLTVELTDGSQIVFTRNGTRGNLADTNNKSMLLPRSIIHSYLEQYPRCSGLVFRVDDNLPTRTGLGGSGSLSVALHVGIEHALARKRGEKYTPDPNVLLQRAHNLEVNELGITGGFQDFVAAFFGKLNHIDFSRLSETNLTTHPTLGTQMETGIEGYGTNPSSARARFREIISYNRRMFDLLSTSGPLSNRLEEIGEIMNNAWELHRSLSSLIGGKDLSDWERLVKPYVYGVGGPGTGANSLVLLTREEGNKQIEKALHPYRDTVEILSAHVSETGVNVSVPTPDY